MSESISKRTLVGRIVAGLWALNFLLMITETVTFSGQSQLSIVLALGAVGLLLKR